MAPVPNKPTVSVDVKQHSTKSERARLVVERQVVSPIAIKRGPHSHGCMTVKPVLNWTNLCFTNLDPNTESFKRTLIYYDTDTQ